MTVTRLENTGFLLVLTLAACCSRSAIAADQPNALDLLAQVATMGISVDIETDEWFTSLLDHPGAELMVHRLASCADPVSRSETAFTIPEKYLVPEGIAYNTETGGIFLGSLLGPRLLLISNAAEVSVFYSTESETDWYGLGMKVHDPTHSLWVCRRSRADSCRTGLFEYDLESGRELRRVLLDDRSGPHLLNDLVLTRAGDLYVTDSEANCLYTLHRGGDLLELYPVDIEIRYPNGIALSDDENLLFVAHSMGVLRVDLEDKTEELLRPSKGITLVGLDGLYCQGRRLIAVRNGLKPRSILRFDLNKTLTQVTQCTVLERAHPLFTHIPTTGVMVDDRFVYIANSQMDLMDDAGGITDSAALRDVVLLVVDP